MQKRIEIFFVLSVLAALFAPFMFFNDLLFPFITSKAFYFRVMVEAALPFFAFLIISNKAYRPSLKNPLTAMVILFFLASLVSAVLGVNVSRSLFGYYERMGGVVYLAHLTLFYFYVLLLGNLAKKDSTLKELGAIAVVLWVLLVVFLKYSGLAWAFSIGSAAMVVGLSAVFFLGKENFLRSFLQLLILLAALTSLNGVFNKLGWTLLYVDPSLPARVSSVFGNPIFFASFLVLPLAFSLFFALSEQTSWKRAYYYVSSFLMAIGVYESGTRGAVVAIIAAAFLMGAVFLVISAKNKQRQKVFSIGFGILVLLLVAGFSFPKFLPEGNLRRVFSLNDANTQSRLIQWKVAVTGFKERPVFGTGPENYYIIADEYYDPSIYQYDPSWFDKPHNYFLEVLTTTGILGAAAFFGLLILTVLSLIKAFRRKIITLPEFSVLLGGFIAYNIQNVFVFDTVSASIVFFGFLGFVGYLRQIAVETEELKQTSPVFSMPAALAGSVLMLGAAYAIYAANLAPMEIGKKIQFGQALTSFDYKAAAENFTKAATLPFNFDKTETAGRYADYAIAIAQSGLASADTEFVKQQLSAAFQYQKSVNQEVSNYPLAWLHQGGVKLLDDLLNNRPLGEEDEEAIYKAIALAPKRVELLQLLLQLRGYQQDFVRGAEVAAKMVELNPYRPQLKHQAGLAYFLAGEKEKGANLSLQALIEGYEPKTARDIFWAGNYFFEQKNYQKAIPIFEAVTQVEPGNLDAFFLLAQSYAENGDKEKARLMANLILKLDPSKKEAVEVFIDSLK